MDSRRRSLLLAAPAAVLVFAGMRTAQAQAKVSEDDPAGKALGYKEDASKVDRSKFKTYAPGQTCANCKFYVTKDPKAPMAPCTPLGGRLVMGKGWCAAWVKA